MSDTCIIILNIISILMLLAFVSYLSHITEDLNRAILKWDRTEMKRLSLYKWCYVMIPTILSIALVQISQLNIGVPHIKPDWTFVAATILWFSLFFFVRGLHINSKIKNKQDAETRKKKS